MKTDLAEQELIAICQCLKASDPFGVWARALVEKIFVQVKAEKAKEGEDKTP